MKDCVSLEIAKKLKEAGWKQTHYTSPYYHDIEDFLCRDYDDATLEGSAEPIAAPTIGSLLEALPKYVYLSNGDTGWMAEHDGIAYPSTANPADALALLWMALKEKNLV